MICKAGGGHDAVFWRNKFNLDVGVAGQARKIEHSVALVPDVMAERDPKPSHLIPMHQ